MSRRGVIVVVLLNACAFAQAFDIVDVPKADLLAEYEPAAKRLKDFYRTVKMTGTIKRLGSANRSLAAREEVSLFSSGDRLRVDVIDSSESGDARRQATVIDGARSFTVGRESGRDAFTLSDLRSNDKHFERRLIAKHHFLYAPFLDYGGIPVVDKLKSPGLRITSVEEEKKDGDTVVTVNYTENSRVNKKPRKNIGSFRFLKDRCWALSGSTWGAADAEDRDCAKIEYGGSINGVPLLKSAEYWLQQGSERLNIHRYEVAEIKPGGANDRDFTLAAFGIRDIGEERESSYWLYLIIAGVVLLAAAIVLARVTARKRARTNHMG